VVSTGAQTRLANIAKLTTSSAKPDTPLTRGLNAVVRLIAAIALGVGGLFLLISLLVGNPLQDGFVFAIGVTVALVPEALLPTVTLSLAWGAEQMAKRQILVRNLEAVETLGSTTFICTDKTGTLTRNQMTVVEAWTPAGAVTVDGPGYDPEARLIWSSTSAPDPCAALALAGMRCSTGYALEVDGQWQAHGDPMEAALDAFAAGWVSTRRATGAGTRWSCASPSTRACAACQWSSTTASWSRDPLTASSRCAVTETPPTQLWTP
jgi:magnesium-transporting ATPase (P-type)